MQRLLPAFAIAYAKHYASAYAMRYGGGTSTNQPRGADMNVKARTTVPTANVAHAAFVACQAARDARKLGMGEDAQRRAYDGAYADALRG
jgi:hypothetical protein